jgi:putative FmdB family regulatory protein
MPLYEYECERCGKRLEVIQKFSDEPLTVCGECGGPVHRLLSSPAVQFKGTGWYVTDYARKPAPAASSPSDGTAKEGEKPATPPTETTKEAKPAESAPPKTSSSGKE